MKGIKQYLVKQEKLKGIIKMPPSADLGLVIVIPAYKEVEITKTISSIYNCYLPSCGVEVIVYVNGNRSDELATRRDNEQCLETIRYLKYQNKNHKIKLHFFENLILEKKGSGVGRARKQLMDEALFRLNVVSTNGLIVNLDADCTVATNYLIEIERYFALNISMDACSIHFEHQLSGTAIVDYELHLRYFIGMQRQIGFPFAFQTVGSAMACRAKTYAAVGGMNKRQAGEDFYFMHKFTSIGVCGVLNSTTIFPSGRISDRVPFGTGKAVGEIESGCKLTTYNPESFEIIRSLVDDVEKIYRGEYQANNVSLGKYLKSISFEKKVLEIRTNTSNYKAFYKRFYQFFDAFKLMKCLHFLRDEGYLDVPLEIALEVYFTIINLDEENDRMVALAKLRSYDKQSQISVKLP